MRREMESHMHTIFKSILSLSLLAGGLSACSAQQPAMLSPMQRMSAPMQRMGAPVQRMAASQASFAALRARYGKGALVKGSELMQGDGGTNFAIQASLPPQVDLRPQFPPVYNQGSTNACVGYSTVGGLGEYFARKRGWNMQFSPRFLWTLGRKGNGNLFENTGMWLEDAIKIMDAYGMAPEAQFPMQITEPAASPTIFNSMLTQVPAPALINEAKKYRISQGWERVRSVHAMRKSLAEGKPVVFAMMTYSNLWQSFNNGGLIPMPGPNDSAEGGHAILAVGYDNARRHFIIRNSWGAEWGDKGYGYLPYDYFRANLKEAPVYAGFTIK